MSTSKLNKNFSQCLFQLMVKIYHKQDCDLFMLSTHMHCEGMACRAEFFTETTFDLNPREMLAL